MTYWTGNGAAGGEETVGMRVGLRGEAREREFAVDTEKLELQVLGMELWGAWALASVFISLWKVWEMVQEVLLKGREGWKSMRLNYLNDWGSMWSTGKCGLLFRLDTDNRSAGEIVLTILLEPMNQKEVIHSLSFISTRRKKGVKTAGIHKYY